ncbi:MAG: acetylglutamate kinase [Deltaproteobacteria bacterium]|nr:MAG: acetylglutamate kinase [Deltaproteobacteria bacterium]
MERMIELLDAIPYLRAYAGQTFVVKAGGELLQEPAWRDGIARDLAVLHRLGIEVVLVHGGGPQLDAALQGAGLPVERVAGRRVTSASILEIAIREWRGACSAAWVSALSRQGETAVGLSGADGGLVRAKRRPPAVVTTDGGERVSVDYGHVGDVCEVRAEVIHSLLAIPSIPVVSPLALGDEGALLNVNADTVAAEVAVAIGAAKLILLTQAPGILRDVDDPDSVLHWTDLAQLEALEQSGALSGGMRPKKAAIERALRGGVPRVHVVDGRRSGALLEEVFTTEGSGTLVVPASEEAPAEPL